MTFKEWPVKCVTCLFNGKVLDWDYNLPTLECPTCKTRSAVLVMETRGESAGIATDEIPGGIEIKHGLCNPDGTPRRYYSKTEIKRAANERGYTIGGDTPKPYNVGWSGKQRRIDGVKEH
jgi:hypothetical protein